MLDSLLPRNRVKVLRLLLGNPSNHYYLREIARACGVPLRAAQREMALYEAMGLVQRVPRGRQVFFAVETGHPLFAELRALIEKAPRRSGRWRPRHLAGRGLGASGRGRVAAEAGCPESDICGPRANT
jgi:DNA-binding transcriptional ArsR family regulator